MRENVTIAVIGPVQPEDFFDLMWEGVWEATFDLSSFGVQVQNLTTDRHDTLGQREILKRLPGGIDAIAILPSHHCALNDLIAEMEDRRIPVITFHSDAPDSRRSAYVGPDSLAAGRLAAEVLSKLMGGRGRVLSFPGATDTHHVAQRYEGFQAAIAHLPGLEESGCPKSADAAAPELLDALGCADGIFVGDHQVTQIAAVLEEARLKLPFVAFTNTERSRCFLERGIISAIIEENRYLQGYFAVQKAYESLVRKPDCGELSGVTIPSTVAFASNAFELNTSLNNAFELLLRQRTQVLCSYKERLEQANSDLLRLAITDPLTGLLNRRRFEEVIDQEVSRALRYGPLALLMIDVNLFKQVNDRYGHQAGDEALKTVAGALKSSCRSTDICARLGGDEFAVILPHSDARAARMVCDQVHSRMAQTQVLPGAPALTLSIGIATLPADAVSADALIAAADRAMYESKEASRFEQPSSV